MLQPVQLDPTGCKIKVTYSKGSNSNELYQFLLYFFVSIFDQMNCQNPIEKKNKFRSLWLQSKLLVSMILFTNQKV